VKKLRSFESDVEVDLLVFAADQERLPRNSQNLQQVCPHRQVCLSSPEVTWSGSTHRQVLTQHPAALIIEAEVEDCVNKHKSNRWSVRAGLREESPDNPHKSLLRAIESTTELGVILHDIPREVRIPLPASSAACWGSTVLLFRESRKRSFRHFANEHQKESFKDWRIANMTLDLGICRPNQKGSCV
jgi:hypothetical protein